MSKFEKFSPILAIGFLVAALAGYVMNIIAVIHTVDIPLTGVFIVRVIGIFFPPVGIIAGYF